MAEPSGKEVLAQFRGMTESFASQFMQQSMEQTQAGMDALFNKNPDEDEDEDDDAEE